MTIEDIIFERRSIRRFKKDSIDGSILEKIIDCGNHYPSRGNKQPLKFILVRQLPTCDLIFDNIKWGSKTVIFSAFADNNYAPTAYILVLVDRNIMSRGYEYEVGASVENMLLCASANGIGSVWIKSFNTEIISELMKLPNYVTIDSIVALGVPAHLSRTIGYNGDVTVSIDTEYNLYVPKRNRDDVIFYGYYGEN